MADIKHLDLPKPPESNRILIEELRRIIRLAYKFEFDFIDLQGAYIVNGKVTWIDKLIPDDC